MPEPYTQKPKLPEALEQNPREQQDASHVDILITISISTLHWSVLMLAVICIFDCYDSRSFKTAREATQRRMSSSVQAREGLLPEHWEGLRV